VFARPAPLTKCLLPENRMRPSLPGYKGVRPRFAPGLRLDPSSGPPRAKGREKAEKKRSGDRLTSPTLMSVKGSLRSGLAFIRTDLSPRCPPDQLRTVGTNRNRQAVNLTQEQRFRAHRRRPAHWLSWLLPVPTRKGSVVRAEQCPRNEG
jgi:hypothetical protein